MFYYHNYIMNRAGFVEPYLRFIKKSADGSGAEHEKDGSPVKQKRKGFRQTFEPIWFTEILHLFPFSKKQSDKLKLENAAKKTRGVCQQSDASYI